MNVDGYSDFNPGSWLWFLTDVEKLETPMVATGRQGFWNWERP